MAPMQFLAAADGWTEKQVKGWVETNGWFRWRRVEGGWMIFQMANDYETWRRQR